MNGFWTAVLWNSISAAGLAGVVGLVSFLPCIRIRPRIAHALWLLVLFKLVAPPIVSLPVLSGQTNDDSLRQRSSLAEYRQIIKVAEQEEERRQLIAAGEQPTNISGLSSWSWQGLAMFAWAIGTAGLWCIAARQTLKVDALVLRAAPAADFADQMARSVAEEFGLRSTPPVRMVDGPIVPMLCMTRRGAAIVFPRGLLDLLPRDQLRCLLAHEIAHYRRCDHWSNLFAFLCASLHWWNPIGWIAGRALRNTQEHCCDAMVIETADASRRVYGESLVATLDYLLDWKPVVPLFARGIGTARTLRERILRLGSLTTHDRTSISVRTAIACLFVLCLCVPIRARQTAQPPLQIAASGQQTIPITGSVVDSAGSPVRNANVSAAVAWRENHLLTAGGTTDSQGEFRVDIPAEWLDGPKWRFWSVIWVHQPGFALTSAGLPWSVSGLPSNDPIRIVMKDPKPPAFRIVADGQPVANAIVAPLSLLSGRAFEPPPDELVKQLSVRTDADGRARLASVDRDDMSDLTVAAEGFGLQRFELSNQDRSDEILLNLQPAGRIRGRISPPRPEWLAGLRIDFDTKTSATRMQRGLAVVERFGADGSFEIPQIAAGPLAIRVSYDESLPVRLRPPSPLSRTVRPGETLDILFNFQVATSIKGLLKADERLASGASVVVRHGLDSQEERVVTDSNGAFTARVLPGYCRIQIVGMPKGFPHWEPSDTIADEQFHIPAQDTWPLPLLNLQVGRPVQGRLVGAGRMPLKGQVVRSLRQYKSQSRFGDRTTTDETGRFTIDLASDRHSYQFAIERQPDRTLDRSVRVISWEPELILERFSDSADAE